MIKTYSNLLNIHIHQVLKRNTGQITDSDIHISSWKDMHKCSVLIGDYLYILQGWLKLGTHTVVPVSLKQSWQVWDT